MSDKPLREADPQVYQSIIDEIERQHNNIELIASENFVSKAVLQAMGSHLTNKYAEGYPGKRYYGGCQFVDQAEQLAIDRAKELFGAEHANVQPHSGAQANMAVYYSILKPGDTVLGMNLAHGGHLTHGSHVNFSGNLYNFISYGVDPENHLLDYNQVEEQLAQHKPKLLVAGASAYPRSIDFKRLGELAQKYNALFMVDMAHIAGLVATGHHMSPVPYADFVTSTTHKTLRGPRGGLILCKQEYAAGVDKAIFPGIQGGPLMHVIAAKAVAFGEALQPEFKEYSHQVVKNAQTLASQLQGHGLNIVSGGTDTHLLLIDVRNLQLTGKEAEKVLDSIDITTNKNAIPYDPAKPFVTSGIRVGTPAVTTRGMKEGEMTILAEIIAVALKSHNDEAIMQSLKQQVRALTARFKLPGE